MPDFQLQYDPADIPKLAAEYMSKWADRDRKMEDAGRRIASGDVTRANLEDIYRWKSARRIGLLRTNTDADIEQALKAAIGAEDVKVAVQSLTSLAGVGVKMASAILTAVDPERYTVLDVRALEAFGLKDSDDVGLYVLYLEACRTMAKQYEVTLRDFDRANWQWSKRRS
ncbi:MAG TPA: hypothetical protein VEU55_03025 [Gemmatimonadales bacterium]|nr:hypothetical protein [Gemmatimonadales bacterium]